MRYHDADLPPLTQQMELTSKIDKRPGATFVVDLGYCTGIVNEEPDRQPDAFAYESP